MRYLALTAAALTLTTAGLAVGTVTPAQAEFEIQEAGVEKGAKELEYRGAVHWGISNQEGSNATEATKRMRAAETRKKGRSGRATTLSSSTALPIVGCSQPQSRPTSRSTRTSI